MSLRARSVLTIAASFSCLQGCMLFRVLDYDEQAEQIRAASRIVGTVSTEGEAKGSLIVVLGRLVADQTEGGTGAERLVGVDTYVRVRPGSYKFVVGAGRYQVGAWEDVNHNGLLDPDERARRVRDCPVVEVAAGETGECNLTIPLGATLPEIVQPVDVLGIVARTPAEQRQFSLGALSVDGEICRDLSDPKFGPESGSRGLWEPMDFLNDGLAGIYQLEPYDPSRVPVLFVHGINGYPQHFTALIESVDRTRFQPWFYFYPSAFPLDGIADQLATRMSRLQNRYRFDAMAVVAHSMGGLVSRGAILKYHEKTGREDVRMFLTISTPWGGAESARMAADAPIELPAVFQDMNPDSDYLRWVFYEDEARTVPKPLPPGVHFHMMMSFHMDGSDDVANDGVVTVVSQARTEAQEQAMTLRAWDYDHVGVLSSPEAIARVGMLLARRF